MIGGKRECNFRELLYFYIEKKKFEDFCMFIFCLFVLNIYMDVEVYYKYNLKVFRWGMLKLI